MDAHSVSFTSDAERSTSRLWRDLDAYHQAAGAGQCPKENMSTTVSIVTNIGKRRAQILNRVPRVGVVGAGLAGLRCADVLLQHGFEVTLIEGRNRLGGRVHQAPLTPGHIVDAGPNWIHGTNNNPILEIAQKTDTATGSWTERTTVVNEAGKILPAVDARACSDMMWAIIGNAFTHSNKNTATINTSESLYDFFDKEVAKRIPETSQNYKERRKVMHQLAESWGAFVGSHVSRQSLKFFWLEECIDGENLFCSDTYEKILAAIAAPVLKGGVFRYNTIVNKVQSTDDETCGLLKLHTENGQILEFDEVVFTAPLGWLKRHQDAFDPPLPPRLTQAIENIGYGCLEKVYISFPKAFWRTSHPESDTQGFAQFIAPNYAPDSNPNRWNQEIVELASFGPSDSHPTLLFYMYGEQSKYLTSEVRKIGGTSSKDKEKDKDKQDAFLYEWFRPYYSRIPGYDGSSPDCQPVGCYATDWLGDDLAGNGSYANFQVGLCEGDRDIEVMREGLPDRGLWLAGEHTAPFVALGTVTGAYWSGESVGKRIAKAYGKENNGSVDM